MAIETLLRDVVALHSAEFGDVQLLAGNELLLVAQIGLGPNVFKEFFARDAKPRMRLRQGL